MTDGKDVGEAIAAIIVGILGGIALSELLSALLKRRCPVCGKPIPNGANSCPYCHTVVRRD